MGLYFPFSARVCLNPPHWLAIRMAAEGLDFQQSSNAFLPCGNVTRLPELADSLTARDLLPCGQKWLAAFTPSSPIRSVSRPAVSIDSSSPRWSMATTLSSMVEPPWRNSPNGYGT